MDKIKRQSINLPLPLWRELMILKAEGRIRNITETILRALTEHLDRHYRWTEREED